MASGLQKQWFVPIAYFLTHRVNGDILKQLIIEAINKLTENGAEVNALVYDGASENLTMATKLGCNVKELDGSFDHPTKPGKNANHTGHLPYVEIGKKCICRYESFQHSL